MQNLHRRFVSMGCLTLWIAIGVGCSKRSSDETIAKDIQDKIAADPATKGLAVSVSAKDGKVTLSGTAASPEARQKLEEIARAVPGATSVEDQIPAPPQEAAAPPSASAPAPVEQSKPQPVVVPAGTVLTVKTGQALSSEDQPGGPNFLATLAQPVSVGRKAGAAGGSDAQRPGGFGQAEGQDQGRGRAFHYTDQYFGWGPHLYDPNRNAGQHGKREGQAHGRYNGWGSGRRSVDWRPCGRGRGAGIGALAGATAGLVGGALTGNKQVEIPVESALSFTLASALPLPPRE